eukprot:Rmarinus@m.4652
MESDYLPTDGSSQSRQDLLAVQAEQDKLQQEVSNLQGMVPSLPPMEDDALPPVTGLDSDAARAFVHQIQALQDGFEKSMADKLRRVEEAMSDRLLALNEKLEILRNRRQQPPPPA